MNMRSPGPLLSVLLCLLFAQAVTAQAPSKPADATGLCNDGTYYTGATKQGACRGHKGVKEWYGSPGTAKAAEAPAKEAASTSTSTAAAAQPATTKTSKSVAMAPAPGGGADKVWLNTSSNVYHCPGTKYYGTTKAGAYMSEDEAKAKGAHPDHGKPCK
jgi:hypothetical protein